jgi:hypothetical protein
MFVPRLVLALSLLLLFYSCSKTRITSENVKNYICYQWELAELDIDGNTVEVDTLNHLNRLIFATNGEYIIKELGESTIGRWTFNEEEQLITTTDRRGELQHKIIYADKQILKTQFTEENRIYTFSYKRIEKDEE